MTEFRRPTIETSTRNNLWKSVLFQARYTASALIAKRERPENVENAENARVTVWFISNGVLRSFLFALLFSPPPCFLLLPLTVKNTRRQSGS